MIIPQCDRYKMQSAYICLSILYVSVAETDHIEWSYIDMPIIIWIKYQR